MSDLLEREDNWFNNANTLNDRSPEAFFLAFEITDKHTAHRRYGLVIERCSIGADRVRLEEFDQWKKNIGPRHWTDQQARNSAMKTAGALIEASEPFAENSLQRISQTANVPQVTPSRTPQDYLPHRELSEPTQPGHATGYNTTQEVDCISACDQGESSASETNPPEVLFNMDGPTSKEGIDFE
ncbi:hypothetical protein BGX27_004732, partial [Mortierella sp. AM989]